MLHQTKFAYTKEKTSKIKNLEISLEKKLQQLHPKKIDLSLERINKLLYKLENPQKKIKNIIHIAGTNGKGSVLAFLKSFIQASGFTVNTYTSPHLINFNERINLNGKNISDKFRLNSRELLQELFKEAYNLCGGDEYISSRINSIEINNTERDSLKYKSSFMLGRLILPITIPITTTESNPLSCANKSESTNTANTIASVNTFSR